MAASPAASETFSHQQASSGPSIAPRPRDLSISTSASSPSGPPTPSSASSPSGCVPAIAIKPGTAPRLSINTTSGAPTGKMSMASVMSPSPATQLTMTSKEWVIPPRPKPGRKPATDTPPTKRKAQNRAAQRAFRERRAARVGELEEELAEVKEEHKKREEELEERIRHLEVESETLRSRCQWLQSTLEKERLDRMRHSIRATPMHPQENGFGGASTPDQVPVQSQSNGRPVAPRPTAQQFSISHIISPPEQQQQVSADLPTCGSCGPKDCVCASAAIADAVVGCGNCTVDSHCACLEAALEAETSDMSDLKRPARASSPSSTFMQQDTKRQRLDPEPTTPMEIDFTAMFSQKNKRTPLVEQEPTPPEEPSHHRDQPQISVEPKDSCGFCSDGGYCVCAEAPTMSTPVTSSLSSSTSLTATAMPVSHHQQQTHTPPPSEDDVVPLKAPPFPMEVTATGAIKLRPFRSSQLSAAAPSTSTTSRSSGCGPNGPGTCAQCIRDPVSGLFCRSLAANFERTSGAGGGCCGGASAAGGCCKSQPQQQTQPEKKKENLGLSLPCAEAYRTLASHKHFDEAAGQIGEWLPRLKAAPAHVAGRQPYEVEAASIMSVLRGFDIRFGKGE
ncbi:bZIP transcription factor [Coniochaeta sp. 2T2.1]|nr:bZIP transcription factor [Coniochaeta sp. 2T2.1]